MKTTRWILLAAAIMAVLGALPSVGQWATAQEATPTATATAWPTATQPVPDKVMLSFGENDYAWTRQKIMDARVDIRNDLTMIVTYTTDLGDVIIFEGTWDRSYRMTSQMW